jgi:hypothetical protein
MHRLIATAFLLLPLATPVLAHEDVMGHGSHPQKTITLMRDRISPTDLTMGKDDVLEFQNLSLYALKIKFLEPENMTDKIRCELINPKGSKQGKTPWALFSWDEKQRLSATIPPGRFASLCTLAPGKYRYVIDQVGGTQAAVRALSQGHGEQGTITVQ